MCQAAIRVEITKLYTIASMPSSAQPPNVAIKVARSLAVRLKIQSRAVARIGLEVDIASVTDLHDTGRGL
jgi:hypothetical protein